MEQFIEEVLWGIIENFYQSFFWFRQEYKEYEKKVENLCQIKKCRGLGSMDLSIEESLSLIRYDHLKYLKEQYLEPLQNLSRHFRRAGYHNSSLLDHYIRDIYYELSILQGEVYKLNVTAQEYIELKDEEESKSILGGIKISFPLKMFHLHNLMQKAKNEVDKIIVYHKESNILVRSFFLFGEEIFSKASTDELENFVRKIYTDQFLELYTRAAYSFFQAGFYDLAEKAAKKAKNYLSQEDDFQLFEQWKARVEMILSSGKMS